MRFGNILTYLLTHRGKSTSVFSASRRSVLQYIYGDSARHGPESDSTMPTIQPGRPRRPRDQYRCRRGGMGVGTGPRWPIVHLVMTVTARCLSRRDRAIAPSTFAALRHRPVMPVQRPRSFCSLHYSARRSFLMLQTLSSSVKRFLCFHPPIYAKEAIYNRIVMSVIRSVITLVSAQRLKPDSNFCVLGAIAKNMQIMSNGVEA